ncbi:MAG: carboxypeptidase-like regulatory domain-containing protein [Candidatus Eremiobacteraeota bacterium]|nr:carboxypeptidase-like regulatory domain-containing protein [Candidatus Eremiobacteraeota bacterium]
MPANVNGVRSVMILAAVATLSGHITDRTTGQPLIGVHVRAGHRLATTDADGRYLLGGLSAARYTLRIESNDVPPESVTVTLRPGPNRRDVRACSTTLDYGCDAAPAPGPG